MLLAQTDQVFLAHHGLPAGVDVHIDSQLFSLPDNIVNLIVAEIQLVAVLRRPASRTVEIAGAGGIHQDQPGDIALMFHTHLVNLFFTAERRLKTIVQCGHFDDMGIHFI